MICVAALIVFAILALFSAKYRPLAKEAFSCVFLKLRLRPCQSGLDRRVRMAITMPFVKRTPQIAKFLYDYFSVFSTLFVLLTIASFAYMAYGGYNYALYGNCNGPGSSGFCVFDPNGPQTSATGECKDSPQTPEALIKPSLENVTDFKVIHPDAQFTVIFFGCYACPYTREAAEPLLAIIEERQDVRFILIDFPIAAHNYSTELATLGNCFYDQNPQEYISHMPSLYGLDGSNYSTALENAPPEVAVCAQAPHPRVAQGKALGIRTGVYGTPTYFIGDKPVVGPLNKRSLEKLINDEMEK